MAPIQTGDGRRITRRATLASAAGLGTVALAGCTSSSDSGSEGQSLSGNIRISGSSTVYPISTAVSELFKEDHPKVKFNISPDGSSAGFANLFIPGDSDLNNASRPISEEEKQQIANKDWEAVEFQLAQDALTVIVNNENDWIGEGLTYAQLEQIWRPNNPAQTWSDVNSSWPDEEIELFGAATTSGTFDYFTETIMGEEGAIRSDFQGTEADDQIAQGVEGSRYAMGYLPFAYYTNNPDSTQAVPLAESGSNYTAPSLSAAKSGEYPLARPLFTYANSEKLKNKKHLQAFVQFLINKSGDKSLIADKIGYVQASNQQVQENLNTLKEYTGGSLPMPTQG
ncbi:MAG: PstS family phosphate ABC transporter substrate-binding protein [Halonotius sp.]